MEVRAAYRRAIVGQNFEHDVVIPGGRSRRSSIDAAVEHFYAVPVYGYCVSVAAARDNRRHGKLHHGAAGSVPVCRGRSAPGVAAPIRRGSISTPKRTEARIFERGALETASRLMGRRSSRRTTPTTLLHRGNRASRIWYYGSLHVHLGLRRGRTDRPILASHPTKTNALARCRQFRRQFPIFESKIHLADEFEGCSLAARPIAAQRGVPREPGGHWRAAGTSGSRSTKARSRLRTAIGASPHEIAVVGLGARAGRSSSRNRLDRKRGSASTTSFPSFTYLWHAQAASGTDPPGPRRRKRGDPTDAFDAILDHDFACFRSHTSVYKNGHRLDLPLLAPEAHAVDALFVVDDYQSSAAGRLT